MQQLKYSNNLNNKLACDFYFDLRLANPAGAPQKYKKDEQYQVILGSKELGIARCVTLQELKYATLSDSVAYAVTGRGVAYLKGLLLRFYPFANWETDKLYFIGLLFQSRAEGALVDRKQISEEPARPIAVQGSLPLSYRSIKPNQP